MNSAAGPLLLSVRPMTAILAVIINLPIVSTDGVVFEGKKHQGVRTTEPAQHSARKQRALGVLVVPVLNLVSSYRRMSAECFWANKLS